MAMKKNLFVIIMAFIIAGNISCSKSGSNGYNNNPPPGGTSANTVDIYGMTFKPATLTVKAGTKITWTNSDGYAHTVTADDGSTFSSGNLAGGSTFNFTPASAGTFNYHCNIHPGMTGKIVVTQ